MNASDAVIPEQSKKVSTSTDAFSQYVELSDGNGIHIEAWGVGEVRENFGVLKDILSDVFADNLDLSDEAMFKKFVDKQFNRIIKLVDSSITDPGKSINDVRGLNNIMRVMDAFIEVNGLFEAMGKVTEIATKAMKLVKTQNN